MEVGELVYCITKSQFQKLGRKPKQAALEVALAQGGFVERTFAELPLGDLLQVIPYTILLRDRDIFCYKRLQGGGEKRLHERYSIGVGGHINPCDLKTGKFNLIPESMMRELSEELSFHNWGKFKADYQYLRLIYDTFSQVSLVHLGFVIALRVPSDTLVNVRETRAIQGCWESKKDIYSRDMNAYEDWTKILLRDNETMSELNFC